MKVPAKSKATSKKEDDAQKIRMLRHDINNQLSNIYLSVEQLRYEIPDASSDCTFYLDAIVASSDKINMLVKGVDE